MRGNGSKKNEGHNISGGCGNEALSFDDCDFKAGSLPTPGQADDLPPGLSVPSQPVAGSGTFLKDILPVIRHPHDLPPETLGMEASSV